MYVGGALSHNREGALPHRTSGLDLVFGGMEPFIHDGQSVYIPYAFIHHGECVIWHRMSTVTWRIPDYWTQHTCILNSIIHNQRIVVILYSTHCMTPSRHRSQMIYEQPIDLSPCNGGTRTRSQQNRATVVWLCMMILTMYGSLEASYTSTEQRYTRCATRNTCKDRG